MGFREHLSGIKQVLSGMHRQSLRDNLADNGRVNRRGVGAAKD